METGKIKIIFFGTAKFSQRYRQALLSAGFEISSSGPDLGVIAYYGKIIPQEVLETPKNGILNVHHSLLPRWRGPSPVQAAILAGDAKTGVTIHLATPKVDAGPILAQKELEIEPEDTYLSLEERLITLGIPLLTETIQKWLEGKIIPKDQNDSEATYSHIIKTEDGHIDWSRSVLEISRQIRALNPEPGTFTFWGSKRLIISQAEKEIARHSLAPGSVVKNNLSFKIAAADDFILPKKLKLEGKKETSPESFLNGYPKIIGTVLS